MKNKMASLGQFLKERRKLAAGINNSFQSRTRLRIEKSQLVRLLWDKCSAINEKAGTVLVEGHSYLPPQPLVSTFIFVRNQAEYIMQLEVRAAKPTLIFVARKWRDYPDSNFQRWLFHLLNLPPCSISISYTSEICEDTVSEQEVERWFFYLISGLSRAYIPSSARSAAPTVLFGTQEREPRSQVFFER